MQKARRDKFGIIQNAQKASAPFEAAIESFDLGYVGLKRSGGGEDPSTNETNETKEKQNKSEETATVSEEEPSESSDKVTVLPKLQYWRVVSNECCGAGGAAYTSDAVDRHLCSLRVPCERDRRTDRAPPGAAPAPPPAPPPAAPAAAAPPPPPPPPGPFIYNTHTCHHTATGTATATRLGLRRTGRG